MASRIEIKARKVASSAGCVSETCVIAVAYIDDKILKSQPVSDDGIIVDRVWVNKKDVYSWLNRKEAEGCVLTAQALASLFYLYE